MRFFLRLGECFFFNWGNVFCQLVVRERNFAKKKEAKYVVSSEKDYLCVSIFNSVYGFIDIDSYIPR